MIIQFNNHINFSLYSYLDYFMSKRGQAFNNYTTRLYPVQDTTLPNTLLRYSSPYKQWVCDTGVGAIIPSSFTSNIGIITPGVSGVKRDFMNGGIIVPSSLGENLLVTGSYSVKDFNLYRTNDNELKVIMENKYSLNSRFSRQLTGIIPNNIVIPAIFLINRYSEEKSFSLGGAQDSTRYYSLVIIGDNDTYVDAAISVILEMKNKNFPLVDANNYFLNEFGEWKNNIPYSYINFINSENQNFCYINKVSSSRISDSIKINNALYVGIVDMHVSYIRHI